MAKKGDYPPGTWTHKQVLYVLRRVRADLRAEGIDETDVRLRVHDGNGYLHVGDASYDQDHRGYIGASCVRADASTATLEATARDLRGQVAEAWALDRTEAAE